MSLPALMQAAKGWANAVLAFIYPEVCQVCGEFRAGPEECYMCAGCRKKVQWIKPPICERCGFPYEGEMTNPFECANCREMDWYFESARSAVVARDQVLEVIHRYKYRRAFWFEPLLAEWLITRAKPDLGRQKWDWIVPVPLYPAKQREREFNQAERLARWLSAATEIPVDTHLLRRVLPTRTQTRLSREERLANMRGAFALHSHQRLQGRRFVLVDDVLTTGSTTNACAKVLRSAGAQAVCVWTVARGI